MSRDIPFYTIELFDASGKYLATVEDAFSIAASRAFNTKGSATIVIPADYPREWFDYDTHFKLWRTGTSRVPHLFGDTVWFLRNFKGRKSTRQYQITAVDTLGILEKRKVAYTAETPYADKTLEEFALVTPNDSLRIDNMMRAYMRENFGSLALDGARIADEIAIERNRSMAPYGEKEAAWADLEAVLTDLARQSAGKGTELFYDLIPQDNNTYMFKIWREVRGIDRGIDSNKPLEFDDESGVLTDVEEEVDYSNYGNYCYVLGYDKGPSQIIVEVADTARIRKSVLGRVEFTYEDSDSDVASVLEAEGQAALRGKRGIRSVAAKISAAATLNYGDQFAYGDRVIMRVDGQRYNVMLDAVATSWAQGVENLDIRLNGSQSL